MFSSSPTSSTGSPRLTRSHPGPPRRTYAKRKTRYMPRKGMTSGTESDNDNDDGENGDRNDGKGSREVMPIKTGKKEGISASSPSLGSSGSRPAVLGRRSSSRLSRSGSSAEQATLTTTREPSREDSGSGTRFGREDTGREKEDKQVTTAGYGRKRARRDPPPTSSPVSSPLPSPSPSPSPTPKERPSVPAIAETVIPRPVRPTRPRASTSLNVSNTNGATPARQRDPATPPRTGLVAGPSTPTSSSPRDYAHLFAAITPDPATLTSPSRKRMIGLSQSSGAVLESPSKLKNRFSHLQEEFGSGSRSSGPSTPHKLGRTNSLPISPSKSILEDAEPDPSAMWIKPAEVEGPGSGGRAKRIYGRTRTVIAEDGDTVSDVEKLEEALSKESYASLRTRYEVNPSGKKSLSQVELSELVLARAPQSANDMKSKGENRRFMDETGYLLDGIEDESGTKGFRRASCVDILGNMQSEEWISKLRVCGQTERVWAAFQGVRGEGDDIMDAVCLLTLHLIMAGEGGMEGIICANAEGCVRFLTSLLKQRSGVLDDRWKGKVTSMVERVREIGRNVDRAEESYTTSTRVLASYILASITANMSGDLVNSALRSERVLGKTIKAILPEIASLGERFDLVESGLPLLPQDDSVEIGIVRNGLAIIDHTITASSQDRDGLAQHPAGLAQAVLQALIAFVSISSESSASDGGDQAAMAIMSCLRIFANISNIAPGWSLELLTTEGALTALARVAVNRISISSRIAMIQKKTSETADTTEEGELLCLVLAIVTSGVLVDENLASVLASLKLDSECRGQQDCLRYCKCPPAEPFVNELARLYASFYNEDTSDAATEVVSAYLALLLSKIITASPSTLTDIAQSLPGDSIQLKLGDIITSLRALDGYRSVIQRNWKDQVGTEVAEWQEDGNEVQKAIEDMLRLVDTY